MSRSKQVATDAEEILNDSVNGEEALRLTRRLEPPHLALPLPGRLVGDLRAVVGVLTRVVDDRRHGGPNSGAIASQFVRHQPVGFTPLSLQQPAKEAFGCTPIPPGLDEDVEHVAILVDRSPEILPPALNRDEELVQVPRIAEATFSPLEPASVFGAELPTPLADRLIGDGDSAFRQEVLDVPEAQAEAVVEPDGVANDLGRLPASAST